jgi:hypothetical protein
MRETAPGPQPISRARIPVQKGPGCNGGGGGVGMPGYGLKYPESIKFTHIQSAAKPVIEPAGVATPVKDR